MYKIFRIVGRLGCKLHPPKIRLSVKSHRLYCADGCADSQPVCSLCNSHLWHTWQRCRVGVHIILANFNFTLDWQSKVALHIIHKCVLQSRFYGNNAVNVIYYSGRRCVFNLSYIWPCTNGYHWEMGLVIFWLIFSASF